MFAKIIKKTFKYAIFSLILMISFSVKANASTTFLLCEYDGSGRNYNIQKMRFVFVNGAFVDEQLGGAQKKGSSSWGQEEYKEAFIPSSNVKTTKYTYVYTPTQYMVKLTGVTECPKQIEYTSSGTPFYFNLTDSRNYIMKDRTCIYGSGNLSEITITIPSNYYPQHLQNNLVELSGNKKSTVKYPAATIPSATQNDQYLSMYMENGNGDPFKYNWRSVTDVWKYLPQVNENDTNGCPKYLTTNQKDVCVKYNSMMNCSKSVDLYYGTYESVTSINGHQVYPLKTANGVNIPGIGADTADDCESLFGKSCKDDPMSFVCLIEKLFDLLKIIIPVILILLGSIDFAKVVVSQDKEAMGKAVSTFVKRVLMAILIFLLPTIIKLITIIFDDADIDTKWECIIENL